MKINHSKMTYVHDNSRLRFSSIQQCALCAPSQLNENREMQLSHSLKRYKRRRDALLRLVNLNSRLRPSCLWSQRKTNPKNKMNMLLSNICVIVLKLKLWQTLLAAYKSLMTSKIKYSTSSHDSVVKAVKFHITIHVQFLLTHI